MEPSQEIEISGGCVLSILQFANDRSSALRLTVLEEISKLERSFRLGI